MVRQWKSPEEFGSAVCVPIASPSMPLGTMWVFGSDGSQYSPLQTNILEIVAGRVASELEREMLLAEAGRLSAARPHATGSAESWRRSRQPTIEPLVENWEFAGWASPWTELGGAFFDWSVLPDGRLALTVGQGHGKGDVARLNGAALHGMLKVLSKHSPRLLTQAISDSFWSASNGDQWASLGYVVAEPESGSILASNAGNAMILLIDSGAVCAVSRPQSALGVDPDVHYRQTKSCIAPGQTLILCTAPGLDNSHEQLAFDRRIKALAANACSTSEQWVRLLRNDPIFSKGSTISSAIQVIRRSPTPA
jgi:serine phosphatase RsbU (regulator of sigma subunit)